VDGRIIFKWIFKKWDGAARAELVWLRIRAVAGACESYLRGTGLLCSSLCGGYKLKINKYTVNHNSIGTFILMYYILGLF